MKVCRMCWALLDDQLNHCNCSTGGDPIFFKDVAEAINHFVNHEKLMSKRSRQLETLVNEKITYLEKLLKGLTFEEKYNTTPGPVLAVLQELVEKSKVNQNV